MTRKPKKPPKLQLVRDDDLESALVDDDENVHPIRGRTRGIFDALVVLDSLVRRGSAFDMSPQALLDSPEVLSFLEAAGAQIDLDPDGYDLEDEEAALDAQLAQIDETYASFQSSINVLARALIAEVLGKPLGADVVADISGRSVDALIRQFDPSLHRPALHRNLSEVDEASASIDNAVHEIGLTEFDAFCRFCAGSDGHLALYAEPLPPLTTEIYLLDFVVDSAIEVAADDETVIFVEGIASAWEFDRWSAPYDPDSVPELQREIRREDYRVLDRPMVTLGASLVDLLAHDEARVRLHPRQLRLAAALTESFVDVFEVTQRDGTRATWKSVTHGTSYEVYEHAAEIGPYETGWVAAGRLIPFDGELHLRSPGAVFAPPEEGLAQKTAETFARLEERVHPTLALEAAISTDIFRIAVPRNEKPALSRSKARLVLEDLEFRIADGLAPDATLTAYRKALLRQLEGASRTPKKSRGRKRRN